MEKWLCLLDGNNHSQCLAKSQKKWWRIKYHAWKMATTFSYYLRFLTFSAQSLLYMTVTFSTVRSWPSVAKHHTHIHRVKLSFPLRFIFHSIYFFWILEKKAAHACIAERFGDKTAVRPSSPYCLWLLWCLYNCPCITSPDRALLIFPSEARKCPRARFTAALFNQLRNETPASSSSAQPSLHSCPGSFWPTN